MSPILTEDLSLSLFNSIHFCITYIGAPLFSKLAFRIDIYSWWVGPFIIGLQFSFSLAIFIILNIFIYILA